MENYGKISFPTEKFISGWKILFPVWREHFRLGKVSSGQAFPVRLNTIFG